VPILILNATTLNTGHNWQFTASFMGEPPSRIDSRIDGNDRLRRMYYREAPPRYTHVRLGHAVAASACVPGLFEALPLAGLYPDRVVRLVDGGVHDNQGTAGLLEQDCTLLLVSDASGQMASQDDPGGGVVGAPMRTNTILQSRVRDAEYHELDARRRSSLLRGLMFLHLKKDLDADPVDWVGCDDPFEASDEARPVSRRGTLTSYGMRKDVQARLAKLRTDLDSFSDLEAFSLMTSGYRMTEREFQASIEGFPPTEAPPEAWRFLEVERLIRRSAADLSRLRRVLEAGSKSAFKLWSLSRGLQRLTRAGVVLLVAGLLLWLKHSFSWSVLGWAALAAAVLAAVLASGMLTLPINVALYLPSWISLRFNGWFLRQGKLR
jgi:predicted acylesterase/phospholipase RssA